MSGFSRGKQENELGLCTTRHTSPKLLLGVLADFCGVLCAEYVIFHSPEMATSPKGHPCVVQVVTREFPGVGNILPCSR